MCCAWLSEKDPKIAKKSPSGHHRTTLSCNIFATKARMGNSSVIDVTFGEKFDDNVVIYFKLKTNLYIFSCFYTEREQLHCEEKLSEKISSNN